MAISFLGSYVVADPPPTTSYGRRAVPRLPIDAELLSAVRDGSVNPPLNRRVRYAVKEKSRPQIRLRIRSQRARPSLLLTTESENDGAPRATIAADNAGRPPDTGSSSPPSFDPNVVVSSPPSLETGSFPVLVASKNSTPPAPSLMGSYLIPSSG